MTKKPAAQEPQAPKRVTVSRGRKRIVVTKKPRLVRDAIGHLPPIPGLPMDIEDQLPDDAPNMTP